MDKRDRIEKLRGQMEMKAMDAYIVPSSDPHMSEYLAAHYMGREWLSGFTGSAGTLVVTQDKSGLWTDGRYFIQAEDQLKGTGIDLFRSGMEGVPSIEDWLRDTLGQGSVVGLDGRLFPLSRIRYMEEKFKDKDIRIDKEHDLLEEIWEDRPGLPLNAAFPYDISYVGKSAAEKLIEVRGKMKKKGVNYHLIPGLDDIAWLYNIRGGDVDYNPVAIAYALVSEEKAWLYIDKEKVSKDARKMLEENGVLMESYDSIYDHLSNLGQRDTILLDPNRTNSKLYESVREDVKKVEGISITTELKAIKNDVEIENLKNAHVRDGVAMVKFLYWLDEKVGEGNLTEVTIADKLEECRREQEKSMGLSFPTIAGYKDHGAIVHYQATEESVYDLEPEGMILIDSGGQYLDGTTDITRTVILGDVSDEERRDYTLVLKGNINLAMAKFLKGATGANLDILARKPLWDRGMDYRHGTGHGVGHFLNVHEGPQSISQVSSKVKLEKGMVVTNEPGLYKEGSHGIRIENELLVVKDKKTDFGEFLKFEVITYCPIDIRGIDVTLLNDDEKKWLNGYHGMVYEKLAPFLEEEEREWLKTNTKKI